MEICHDNYNGKLILHTHYRIIEGFHSKHKLFLQLLLIVVPTVRVLLITTITVMTTAVIVSNITIKVFIITNE